MPGPIRTFTRLFEPTDAVISERELFTTFVQYYDRHPNFTRIASNYGTNGTGLENSYFFSGSSGEQAFVIFRSVSSSKNYDIALMWSYNSNYTAGTWTGNQTFGAGIMMAWHSSSAAWSGSVNNNGTDAFLTSSRPWKTGSVVFPRANSVGGTWATNQNAPLKLVSTVLSLNDLWQVTVIGDDETTYAFAQSADASIIGDSRYFWAWGTYTPLTSAYNLPLFMYCGSSVRPEVNFGEINDERINSPPFNGGVAYISGSDVGSRTGRLSSLLNAPRRAPRPASILMDGVNDRSYGFPILLSSYESGHYHQLGVLSGVLAIGASAFGNLQDVSRSYVTFKIENTTNSRNFSFALPYSGSIDYFLRGTFE